MTNWRIAGFFLCMVLLITCVRCRAPQFQSGKIALKQGNNNEAIAQFTKTIEADPKNGEAYYWLGIAYARKKLWENYAVNTEKAFSLNPKLIENAKKEKDPDNHSIYFFYSARRNYFEDKDYERALKRTVTSLLFNSRNIYSLNLKALCLTELKRDDEAEKTFQKAIELKPNFIDSYVYLAEFYKSKTEYEKEEEILQKAKKIIDNPEWFGTVDEDSLKIKKADAANIFHDLGANHFNQNELDEAACMLKKAMEFDPESRNIAYDLGTVFAEQEDWREAATAFDRVIEIDPLDFYAHFNLGFSYLMLSEYLNAIKQFTWVIEQDPECCDAYFKRAMCYRELGNSAAAYNDVKKGKECEERNNGAESAVIQMK